MSGVCQIYFLNDLSLQQPGSLAVENEVRRQSSLVTDNESLWLSSCYQDGPDEVLTVNYLLENFQTIFIGTSYDKSFYRQNFLMD